MINKPRKLGIAILLNFLALGLGHLYAGSARKGFILYLIVIVAVLLVYPLLLIVCYFSSRLGVFIYFIVLLSASLSFIAYCIIDVIRISREGRTTYSLRKYNKWYIYTAYFIIGSLIILPITKSTVKSNIAQVYRIPSGAMKETLLIGDHIVVNKFIYGIKNPFTKNIFVSLDKPKREDIIVFKYPINPELDFIKRVVGVEGDIIEVQNKKLYVNDELVEREYAVHTDPHTIPAQYVKRDFFGPIIVPPESLFVMGDNRDNSKDSRFWGFVPLSVVKGKAFSIYWSMDNWKVRWDRIGKRID
jgi:signal peptidase I